MTNSNPTGPTSSLRRRLGIDHPIVQSPMAGAADSTLAIAVARSGGLGSLPCAIASPDAIQLELSAFRRAVEAPVNLNFFCHAAPRVDVSTSIRWSRRLDPLRRELGLPPAPAPEPQPTRATIRPVPFGDDACRLIEQLRPEVVSFHFGLPRAALVERVRATGAIVLSSATSAEEGLWLEEHGCDVVIAQGLEAGGHRGMFLHDDISTQSGTLALVPALLDCVSVPVIAAGGIDGARNVAAVLSLGAAGVQMGTAFLRCPEATTTPLHRAALAASATYESVLTNVFTGRPARALVNRAVTELGPMSVDVPPFPIPVAAMAELRAAAEASGDDGFTPLWAGQSARFARAAPAGELIRDLVEGVNRTGAGSLAF